MEQTTTKIKGLPDNAFTELKPGEEYAPLVPADKINVVTVHSGNGVLKHDQIAAVADFVVFGREGGRSGNLVAQSLGVGIQAAGCKDESAVTAPEILGQLVSDR